MALTGLFDNDKFIRTDKPIKITGDTYVSGVYVNGRFDYAPLIQIDRLDETTQLATTEFTANHSKRRYNGSNSVTLTENRYYTLTISSNTVISLPNPEDKTVNNEIMVSFVYQGGSVNLGTDLFLDGITPVFSAETPRGTIYYDYDPNLNKWFCGVLFG